MAAVKDLCTKKVVGYAFSSRIDTQLTLSALDMAVRREQPSPGLIFHSDRGIQCAAEAFRRRLAALGIRQSMSRKGDPYDNSVAENFFSCLKCELVHLRRYDPRQAAQADIFAYIEAFYNTLRPHSAIDWLSPCALNCGCVMPLSPDLRGFTYYCDSFRFSALFTAYFFGKGSHYCVQPCTYKSNSSRPKSLTKYEQMRTRCASFGALS